MSNKYLSEVTLKQARVLADKRQCDVANFLGISRSTYIKMEKNPKNISVGMAQRISKYLDIPTDMIKF